MKLIFLITIYLLLITNKAHAYLDPGTGSYIFQVMAALVIGGLYTIKMHWQKIKTFFSNHVSKKQDK